MKITITGSLGHISKPLAEELVQKGHDVTVISHNPERQKDIEALGATAAIGSIEDGEFLKAAFTGAEAVYTMITGAHFSDPNFDFTEHANRLSNNYAQAIHHCGIKRVVQLSSIGAHMKKDSGLILLYLGAESILDKLQGVDITFMRPVGFYYNLLGFIPAIKNTGMMASNYGADDMIPWVSPIDIAARIAEELVKPARVSSDGSISGRKVLYVASEELTCNKVAGILGEAIGKPDLKWVLISDEQLLNGMEAAGLAPAIAKGLVEMQASMHKGIMYEDYYRNKPELGKVKLKDYAKEFATIYNQ